MTSMPDVPEPGHPLARVLAAAVDGRFPGADAGVDIVATGDRGREAVLDATAHAFIATAIPREEVLARRPDGLGRALMPEFLLWLAGPEGRLGSHDVVLGRTAVGGGTALGRTEALNEHGRVRRARSQRTDVAVFADESGLFSIGRNDFGWLEVSIEVEAHHRSAGHGRRLIGQALRVPPVGTPVFAHVAPGNSASLRAFLAAGFVPLGSVVFIQPGR